MFIIIILQFILHLLLNWDNRQDNIWIIVTHVQACCDSSFAPCRLSLTTLPSDAIRLHRFLGVHKAITAKFFSATTSLDKFHASSDRQLKLSSNECQRMNMFSCSMKRSAVYISGHLGCFHMSPVVNSNILVIKFITLPRYSIRKLTVCCCSIIYWPSQIVSRTGIRLHWTMLCCPFVYYSQHLPRVMFVSWTLRTWSQF